VAASGVRSFNIESKNKFWPNKTTGLWHKTLQADNFRKFTVSQKFKSL